MDWSMIYVDWLGSKENISGYRQKCLDRLGQVLLHVEEYPEVPEFQAYNEAKKLIYPIVSEFPLLRECCPPFSQSDAALVSMLALVCITVNTRFSWLPQVSIVGASSGTRRIRSGEMVVIHVGAWSCVRRSIPEVIMAYLGSQSLLTLKEIFSGLGSVEALAREFMRISHFPEFPFEHVVTMSPWITLKLSRTFNMTTLQTLTHDVDLFGVLKDDPLQEHIETLSTTPCRVTIVPCEEPGKSRIVVEFFGVEVQFPHVYRCSLVHSVKVAKACARLLGEEYLDSTPIPDEDVSVDYRSVLSKFVPVRELREEPRVPRCPEEIPNVLLSDRSLAYYAPLGVLPDLLKTRCLTRGQIRTLEFMMECERTPFIDGYLRRVSVGEGSHHLYLSPYEKQPITWITNEALDRVRNIGGGLIANDTGTGKTLSALLLPLQQLFSGGQERTLYLVPDALVEHWGSELSKHTSLKVWRQAMIPSGSPAPPKRRPSTIPPVADRAEVVFQAAVMERSSDMDYFCLVLRHRVPLILVMSFSAFRYTGVHYLGRMHFRRVMVDEAHSLPVGTLGQLDRISRVNTFALTATPYCNTRGLMQLLRMDNFFQFRTKNAYDDYHGFSLFVAHMRTIQNVMPAEHLKVHVETRMCPMADDESAFFREIHQMLLKKVEDKRPIENVPKIFRILERLAAGGLLYRKLLMRIIENSMNRHWMARRWSSLTVDESKAPRPSFCSATDLCPICLEVFGGRRSLVQTACGHVYCEVCLGSMLDLNITKCANACGPLHPPFYRPRWVGDVDAVPLLSRKRALPEEYEALQREMEQKGFVSRDNFNFLLRGVSEGVVPVGFDRGEFVNMQGKLSAIQEDLVVWSQNRSVGEQLVLYTKEQVPSLAVARLVTDIGLRVLCAGVMGCRKRESVSNIEAFRRGEGDVLLISNRYSDGFDLFMVKNLWMLNADLNAHKMQQSEGRIKRVGQIHKEVYVRIYVYPNTFDHFLSECKENFQQPGRRHLVRFIYWMFRQDESSFFHRVHELECALRRRCSSTQIKVSSREIVFEMMDITWSVAMQIPRHPVMVAHDKSCTNITRSISTIDNMDEFVQFILDKTKISL